MALHMLCSGQTMAGLAGTLHLKTTKAMSCIATDGLEMQSICDGSSLKHPTSVPRLCEFPTRRRSARDKLPESAAAQRSPSLRISSVHFSCTGVGVMTGPFLSSSSCCCSAMASSVSSVPLSDSCCTRRKIDQVRAPPGQNDPSTHSAQSQCNSTNCPGAEPLMD